MAYVEIFVCETLRLWSETQIQPSKKLRSRNFEKPTSENGKTQLQNCQNSAQNQKTQFQKWENSVFTIIAQREKSCKVYKRQACIMEKGPNSKMFLNDQSGASGDTVTKKPETKKRDRVDPFKDFITPLEGASRLLATNLKERKKTAATTTPPADKKKSKPTFEQELSKLNNFR